MLKIGAVLLLVGATVVLGAIPAKETLRQAEKLEEQPTERYKIAKRLSSYIDPYCLLLGRRHQQIQRPFPFLRPLSHSFQ